MQMGGAESEEYTQRYQQYMQDLQQQKEARVFMKQQQSQKQRVTEIM